MSARKVALCTPSVSSHHDGEGRTPRAPAITVRYADGNLAPLARAIGPPNTERSDDVSGFSLTKPISLWRRRNGRAVQIDDHQAIVVQTQRPRHLRSVARRRACPHFGRVGFSIVGVPSVGGAI